MKKRKAAVAAALLIFSLAATPAFADSAPGDRVITIGNDLTDQQKQQMYTQFGKTDTDEIVTVTHDDEEKSLSGLVPASVIGTRAISSSLIVYKNAGSGITVTTNNITWVSSDMYRNALLTAGVKDADISVSAPFPVSGTAGLAGIIKAFEVSTGTQIPQARQQAANDELVTTGEIGQQIGDQQKAAALVSALKEKVQEENPKTDDQYQSIIDQQASQMHIQLTDKEKADLLNLLKKIQSLHIDWKQLGNQMEDMQSKISNYINAHPQQKSAFVNFFSSIWNAIVTLCRNIFS